MKKDLLKALEDLRYYGGPDEVSEAFQEACLCSYRLFNIGYTAAAWGLYGTASTLADESKKEGTVAVQIISGKVW